MNGPSQALSKSKSLIAIVHRFDSLLRHYAVTRSLNKTKILHAHTITSGILHSPNFIHLLSNLAVSYAFCGCVPLARKLFDDLSDPSLFLRNAIIKMYVDKGLHFDALIVFHSMICSGKCWPDKYTFPLVIKACSEMSMLKVGVLIQGRALVSGFSSNMFVQNSLLAMYMNCGKMELARRVFDVMPERSVVSWNTMISGWFQNGRPEEALVVFNRMVDARVEPDSATMVSVLPSCGYLKDLELGSKVHKLVEKNHLQEKIEVRNALVDMYSRCGCMDEASQVFAETNEKDVITWTSMINGYIINGNARSALALCPAMQLDGVVPNSVTLASLLSACSSLCCLKQGKSLHAWVMRKKLDSDVLVVTALIDMYAKCNAVSYSFQVFAKTSKKRTVPWNALLSGLIHNGRAREAVGLFKTMLMEEVEANQATFNSVIPAYAILADLKQVLNLHSYLVRSGFISRIEVITGLIDIYSKCGSLDYAHKIFDEIPNKDKDIIVWSVVIAGYGMHGHGETAVSLFNQMVQSGVKPNEITFTSVLHACSHRGLVDDGLALFKYMIENHPSSPRPNHYTCVVDLLGRAGRLDEAYDLIKSMPFQHNHSIWGALLGACSIHQNVELGEAAAERLFELEPENTGNYILLANIYATVGRWKDAEKVRHTMSKIGLRKMPAQSSVGVAV
ncbi:pentatricopeptide repeat-containing protein At5g39350 [Benincasa hispida]|uniref:pentatricopeptide repeat-containing protein At5g39350 n=1 Tax=Benincasa hispida TaxID=102211 RepID=UPI0019027800|nr:pentatricopeptide repeat-containing protein At5g39350 [Benincasa hispida]